MSDESHGKSKGHGSGHGGHGAGHGGGGHEEHEGAPEWLISFADMVMLMMGFFVILFALNISPQRRAMGGSSDEPTHGAPGSADVAMLDFAIAVREAFNNPVDMRSTDPAEQALIQRLIQRRGESDAKDPGVKGREHDVQSLRPSDYYALSASIPFTDDSTELSPGARETVLELARRVRGHTLVIEVRGHVSAAEAYHRRDRAMRLSFERSLAVAQVLAANGVDWWQMRLLSSADHDRINAFPNDDHADRANGRVEVIVTDEVVPAESPVSIEPPEPALDSPPDAEAA